MPSPTPEPDLLVAAACGDCQAQHRLLEAWGPTVLRWCTWLSRPGVEPEDVTHDVLLAVLTRLRQLRDVQAFPAWLFRIVQRHVARHNLGLWLRRRGPTPLREPESDAPLPDRVVEQRQARAAVLRVLARLPRRQREVLVLCLIEERTCHEAAAILGIPEGTAKRRLQAAREGFRRAHARIHGGMTSSKEAAP